MANGKWKNFKPHDLSLGSNNIGEDVDGRGVTAKPYMMTKWGRGGRRYNESRNENISSNES